VRRIRLTHVDTGCCPRSEVAVHEIQMIHVGFDFVSDILLVKIDLDQGWGWGS
jgi:hypothetical protein